MTLVETLCLALEEFPKVRLAVLFGSAAKGRAHRGSDLDVGVSLEGENHSVSGIAVALEREPHSWAEFRAHAMIDWLDWAPTARIVHEAMKARLKQEAGRGPT